MDNNVLTIIISIAASIIASVIVGAVIATLNKHRFLKHIPDEVQKRLNNTFDARLAADANWHSSVITALNPDNRTLHSEHDKLEQELHSGHDKLEQKLDSLQGFIIGEAREAKVRREISDGISDVGKSIALIEKLADDRSSLNNMKNELADLQQKYSNLQSQYEIIVRERDSLIREKTNEQRQATYIIDMSLNDEEEPEL